MRLFYYVIGLVITGALASIGSWVAFGPGPRTFSGTGLFLLSPEASAMVGRIVFGLGAVLTWLCAIALAVRLVWQFRSPRNSRGESNTRTSEPKPH